MIAEPLHVACAADRRYLPHCAAMLDSVLEHGGAGEVHVHLLCDPGLVGEGTAAVAAMVESRGGAFTVHPIAPERVEGMPGWEYIGPSMWFRIFLPEELPGARRVLYLDVDTIVCDSLAPLAELDLGDHLVAAVTNVFPPEETGRPAALGLAPGQAYFNSGVLLLNLVAMRADDSTAKLAELARGGGLLYPDQDALNVVLGGRRLALEPRWNAMNSLFLYPAAEREFGAGPLAAARSAPAIRHFEGPAQNKPWHYLCGREAKRLYGRHRARTPWPDFALEGRTPANVLRRYARRIPYSLRVARRRLAGDQREGDG